MSSPLRSFLTALSLALSGIVLARGPTPVQIRAGMIGLDTSHVQAFTGIFNSPKAEGDVAGITVLVGYPSGIDMPASRDRAAKFADVLAKASAKLQ